MRKKNWLGSLQVCVTRNDGLAVLRCEVEQRLLRRSYESIQVVYRFTKPQTQISGNLIVAAAASVQLQTVVSNKINQTCFNKRMNIFELNISKI